MNRIEACGNLFWVLLFLESALTFLECAELIEKVGHWARARSNAWRVLSPHSQRLLRYFP
jgi:hypothetical protein